MNYDILVAAYSITTRRPNSEDIHELSFENPVLDESGPLCTVMIIINFLRRHSTELYSTEKL